MNRNLVDVHSVINLNICEKFLVEPNVANLNLPANDVAHCLNSRYRNSKLTKSALTIEVGI